MSVIDYNLVTMVDRSSEFANITSHLYSLEKNDITNYNHNSDTILDIASHKRNISTNSFLSFAIKIHLNLNENEILIKQIQKLIKRKEFSNDATTLVNDISGNVHSKLAMIYKDVEILKLEIEKITSSSYHKNIQNKQHFEFILQYLHKIINEQLSLFKTSMKIRDNYLIDRNKRVLKYGTMFLNHIEDDILIDNNNNKIDYHMFVIDNSSDIQTNSIDNNNYNTTTIDMINNTDLRYRKTTKHKTNLNLNNCIQTNSMEKSKVIPPFNHQTKSSLQTQQQQQYSKVQYNQSNDIRVKQAQQVETSILQMGKLFSQMANLVSEQNDVILRIEDDVETGLNDTLEAQTHIEKVYDITKSNRSVIIKIFLLLVFFIVLFLIWT